MKNRLFTRLFLWAVFWLSAGSAFSQSMTLNILPRVVCLGSPIQVDAFLSGVNVNDVDSFRFDWGNGDVNLNTLGTPVSNTRTYQYPAAGIYHIKVTAIFKNRAPIEASEWDTVYNKPVAAFTMLSVDSQCFKYNSYCFKDLTTQAAPPSLPLNRLIFAYGDGDSNLISVGETKCHRFGQGNRRFNVTLTTTDIGGCETKAFQYVFVAPNIDPRFSVSGTPKCDTTPYIFVNNTPVSTSNLLWFRWEYGDDSVYQSQSPIVPADLPRWSLFTYKYTKNGVFNPRLIVRHKQYNCADTFDYVNSGNQLPENIVLKFDIRSRRSNSNDTIADSVCLMNLNSAGVCLYNNYPLQGVNSQIQLLWDFADPNANPPGSDKKLNEVTPCYKYQSFGHYFPILYVSCPGQPVKVARFWSRIDTAQLSDTQYVPPPVANPSINTINGYFFRTNDCISQYRWIYDKRGPTQQSTFTDFTNDVINLNAHGLNNGDRIVFVNLGTISGLSYCDDYYVINATTNAFQLARTPGGPFIDLVTGGAGNVRWEKIIPGNINAPRDSIVSYWKWFNDDRNKVGFKVPKTKLQGYGVNIMGPLVQVEDPNVPITIKQFLKMQCGPDLPVEFTNATNAYQSNNLYIRWDFADNFAPRCTSFSLPNPAMPNGGNEPYVNANDMFNRTLGRFVVGGRIYPGRVNCNFSHDTLPIHQFEKWSNIFRWYYYGHDFPPFDSSATGWTKDPALVTPGPGGRKLVHPLDSTLWGKPVFSAGVTPSRIDTLARMWPADIQPNRFITLNRAIPDPIANSKGYWQYTIPAGTRVDTNGFFQPRINDRLPDGTNRFNYRGNTKLPGTNMTMYEYFFNRSVAQCYTVKLFEKDSFNNQSGDPYNTFSRINMVGGNIIIQQRTDTTPGYPLTLTSDTFNYSGTTPSIYPIIDSFFINNNGSGYVTNYSVIPTGGSGTGMEIHIYADSGKVKGIEVLKPGRGYVVNDVLTIPGGGGNATFTIKRVKDVLVYNYKYYPIMTDASNGQKYILKRDDEFFVDYFDCGSEATVQLPLVGVDAYGIGKLGKECPGLKNGQSGGDPRVVFNNSAGNPGAYPDCSQRSFILLNYDSLLDRKDNTPCDLDGFVSWDGTSPMTGNTITPGGNTFPGFFNSINFPALNPWTSASGAVNWTHYIPAGPSPYTNMPIDKRGFVTIGVILGSGCATFACTAPACLSDTVWYHDFFHFITLDASFTYRKVGGYSAYGVPSRLPDQDYLWDTTQNFIQLNPAAPPPLLFTPNGGYREPWSRLFGKGDIIQFDATTKQQDYILADVWDWGDGIVTVDSFYTNKQDTFVKLDASNPNDSSFFAKNMYPINRVRYEFETSTFPWTILSQTVPYPVGQRVYKAVRFDTIYQCWDLVHAYPPTQINRVNILVDTAFFLHPVNHQYTKSSYEMPAGPGSPMKKNEITEVQHNVVTVTECANNASRQIVIGVMDTFVAMEGKDISDGVLCVGQTVTFLDSIRYWFPFSSGAYNPSRPLPPGVEPMLRFIDMHGIGMNGYPIDSIKVYPNVTKYYSTVANSCPTGWLFQQQGTAPNLYNFCIKIDTNFFERIYWDFESDGVIDAVGKNPSHKFSNPGRFKVSMISRDTVGYFDTCFTFMDVVKPIAHFNSQKVFACSDPTIFYDSSYIIDGCAVTTGFPCDQIKERRWWFGDYGYGKDDYRSTLKDPYYPYRKNGWYRVQEVIETNQGCFDTTFKDIYISGPRPRIKLLEDTLGCVPYKVRVVSYPNDSGNLSATASTLIRSGRSDGGYNTISVNNPDTITIIYDKEGLYYITAVGYDKNPPVLATCPPIIVPDTVDGLEKPIRVYVKNPYHVEMETDKNKVCVGEVFKVRNMSDMDTITKFRMYAYNENFTAIADTAYKTNFDQDSAFKYVFYNSGVYNLVMHSTRFIPNTPPCESKDTVQVTALKAKADLKIDSLELPKFYIWNKCDSTLASQYRWIVYNPDGSERINVFVASNNDPMFNLGLLDLKNDTGNFLVCVWAMTDGLDNCYDSACKMINNNFQVDIDIPNVITPNDDGKNDVFNIKIKGEEVYELKIWNRWGGQVFESTDSKYQWNGRTNNTGEENPEGTYYFVFRYRLRGQQENTVRGTITLIRDK